MDCGPACLRMVAQAYGRKHSLQHLRNLSNIFRRGVNMQGIGDAAEAIGLHTMVRTSFEKLSEKARTQNLTIKILPKCRRIKAI